MVSYLTLLPEDAGQREHSLHEVFYELRYVTLGHLLTLRVTAADIDDRKAVAALAGAVAAVMEGSVEKAFIDQGYTGERAAAATAQHSIELEIVRLPQAKRGFVLLPRRWVFERSFTWATCFRRLVKDYARPPTIVTSLHLIAFACLISKNVAELISSS